MKPRAEDPGAWRLITIAPSGHRYETCGCGESLRLELERMLRAEGWTVRVAGPQELPLDFFAPVN